MSYFRLNEFNSANPTGGIGPAATVGTKSFTVGELARSEPDEMNCRLHIRSQVIKDHDTRLPCSLL